MTKMLSVYYFIDKGEILVTEKKYFDKHHYLQDYTSDSNYIRIDNAMSASGYRELSESLYQCPGGEFDHKEFVKKLATHGINMIYKNIKEDIAAHQNDPWAELQKDLSEDEYEEFKRVYGGKIWQ